MHIHVCVYHKVWEYFVYRDGHGSGSMAIHLAHHYFIATCVVVLCEGLYMYVPLPADGVGAEGEGGVVSLGDVGVRVGSQ